MAANRDATILFIGGDGQPHSYAKKLRRYVQQTTLKSGERHIMVSHDDWCAFFKDGVCNCDPDIREMLPWEIVGT